MTAITILDTGIRQDAQGRFCLNDMHRAAVAAKQDYKRCQIEHFTRTDTTRALVDELRKNGELDFEPLVSTAGRYGGTYACRELVIAYAAWISPVFHLKVLQVFLATTAPVRPLLMHPQPSYMVDAWFVILRYQAGCTMHRALARALQIHESTLSQVLNGSGYYGDGRCSTDRIARRVLRVFCSKQRVHPRQLSLV